MRFPAQEIPSRSRELRLLPMRSMSWIIMILGRSTRKQLRRVNLCRRTTSRGSSHTRGHPSTKSNWSPCSTPPRPINIIPHCVLTPSRVKRVQPPMSSPSPYTTRVSSIRTHSTAQIMCVETSTITYLSVCMK